MQIKHPAARKPAGHVQRELMLVFHASCGFQEEEGEKEMETVRTTSSPSRAL